MHRKGVNQFGIALCSRDHPVLEEVQQDGQMMGDIIERKCKLVDKYESHRTVVKVGIGKQKWGCSLDQ